MTSDTDRLSEKITFAGHQLDNMLELFSSFEDALDRAPAEREKACLIEEVEKIWEKVSDEAQAKGVQCGPNGDSVWICAIRSGPMQIDFFVTTMNGLARKEARGFAIGQHRKRGHIMLPYSLFESEILAFLDGIRIGTIQVEPDTAGAGLLFLRLESAFQQVCNQSADKEVR